MCLVSKNIGLRYWLINPTIPSIYMQHGDENTQPETPPKLNKNWELENETKSERCQADSWTASRFLIPV